MSGELYQAPPWLRNAHVQSVLASSGLRRARLWRAIRELERHSSEHLLTLDDGTRLQGFHTPRSGSDRLVLLFHGWEGSAHSTYMLETASRLWREGFSVFRLNFRDHGNTHHLNRDIFHSCRIDEVVAATGLVGERFTDRPLLVAGYSLGGNFALRVGLRAAAAGLSLERVFAVCPVIDPGRGLEAIMSAPWFYNYYFMRKWRSSLKRKGELFPEHGITREMLAVDMRELTDRLVRRYTEFEGYDDYLDGYALTGDRLHALGVPATVIAAADDPVIPVDTFEALHGAPNVELIRIQQGGHCGFIRNLGLRSWAPEYLARRLRRLDTPAIDYADQERATC